MQNLCVKSAIDYCFIYQVLHCKRDNYYSKSKSIALITEKTISEDYLHKCNMDCETPCQCLDTARGHLWICKTCHYKIGKGKIAGACTINRLEILQ